MLGITEEVKKNSEVTFSYGLLHMDTPVLTSKYLHQLCADTGCILENLLGAMGDKDGWHERAMEPCGISMT